MDNLLRMKELIKTLDEASRAYYQAGSEIMSNEAYDRLYDELVRLEAETGTVLAGSPTQNVGYEVLSSLPKEKHAQAALSLDKTKEVPALQDFLGDQTGVLSWKLDGLTVVLTYENGELLKAVTRGNGEVGEVVTENARCFTNLPLKIPFRNHLVLRGEAVISYPDFETINAEIDEDSKYKNPRNLCAGSVRQLDSRITKQRRVRLIAFALIEAEGFDDGNSMNARLDFLDSLGFETVQRVLVTKESLPDAVAGYKKAIETYEIPSDGLVLVMEDMEYGRSLGRTAKFPRSAIAFKWQDELAWTHLLEIEWSASRTGLINPVAVFEPVELEGTTVSRASVHNVSIVRELQLGIGDEISVYKANMIIPQIAENRTKSGKLEIPAACPVCGGGTFIRDEAGVQTLHCLNEDCPAKQIKRFALFVSRNAMNIDGLSEMTLEKLIDLGYIRKFGDLFRLGAHRSEIMALEGFGEKSADNLLSAIEKSAKTTLSRLLFGIGIPGIGVAGGKLLAKAFSDDLQSLRDADIDTLSAIENIGAVTALDIYTWFRTEKHVAELEDLLSVLTLEKEAVTEAQTLSGKTFCVTGAVHEFENRDALKAFIEARGGKVAGSVSKNTDYLINNDVNSSSTKNKTARQLGIPILSEADFLAMVEES